MTKKDDALTLPKQFQNNFEKVLKTTFWTPKVTKSRMPILQKVSIFRIFLLFELFFGPSCWKKKCFPLIAKDIKKKGKKIKFPHFFFKNGKISVTHHQPPPTN